MTAETKIAQNRLTLLQLAEQIHNISEACRRRGVSRSQFYEYKRAFQEHGFEGLKDLPPIPKICPHETPAEVKERILSLSIAHPAWGQVHVSDHLRLEGITVSPSTVRNLWLKEGLATKYQRILRLEEETHGKDIELTAEQIKLLEKANPCFKERHVESRYPGYLLCQDTFSVGVIKGVGRVYLQTVVDTYGSYAFAKLYTSKLAETAVDVLYDRVLPFYESHGLTVEHILTDNGREFCGRAMIHPYQIFLDLYDIKHRTTKVATPRTNGFVERFNRTVLDEFFREAFRKKLYLSIEELQVDLDTWLQYYNTERPHRGYRNMGRRPIETIEQGKKVRTEKLNQNKAA
jgi:transposase InsO family protein